MFLCHDHGLVILYKRCHVFGEGLVLPNTWRNIPWILLHLLWHTCGFKGFFTNMMFVHVFFYSDEAVELMVN